MNDTHAYRAGKALVEAAKAKNEADRLERMLKRIEAELFLHAHGSVEQRKALARSDERYVSAEDEYIAAASEANQMRAKADALHLIFEEWRTEAATKRAEMQLV